MTEERQDDMEGVPTIDAKVFEARWRRAGYKEWPPQWRDIIPKLTDEQVVDLLDKMPKMGKTWK